MIVSKKKAVIIYAASTEKVVSVMESDKLHGCNVVGICTDELVLGDLLISGVPIIQMNEIDSFENPIVLLLDENAPAALKRAAVDGDIPMCKIEEVSFEDYSESACEEQTAPIEEIPEPESPSSEEEAPEESESAATEAEQIFEESEPVSSASSCFSDEQVAEITNALSVNLAKIHQAINNTKTKDLSIYNINKELQKFKDGYYTKLTSPIITEMITLREDFKKSIEDCSKFNLTFEKQVSYLEATIDQIDEILMTYDVVVEDGKYSYNGRVIYPSVENVPAASVSFNTEYDTLDKEACTQTVGDIKDASAIEKFLNDLAENVEKLLSNNEALIKSIELQNSDLKKQTAVTDGLLIIPLLKKIIRMKLTMKEKCGMLADFKEEAETIYKEAYSYGITYAENILTSLGVNVRSNIDDIYDPKYHRILKMQKITAEEAEKDKHIASFVTDCYVSEERVIAPAKIIVYKL